MVTTYSVKPIMGCTIYRTEENAAFFDAWARTHGNQPFVTSLRHPGWTQMVSVVWEQPEPVLDAEDISLLADVFHMLLTWQGTHALYRGKGK